MSSRGDAVRLDPVRLRLIEAMERRASAHGGEARRLLDERIAALRSAGEAEVAAKAEVETDVAAVAHRPGPLSGLVAHIAAQAASRQGAPSPDTGVPATTTALSAATEPAALAYFRRTWARLSADRRLTRSLATVPDNAGPLNSHHLAHRTLASMRELSPGYLAHFMAYADALSWIEQASGGGGGSGNGGGRTAPGGEPPVRTEGRKAAGRNKAR